MVSVSSEAKLLPETVSVYVPPSAMQDEHEALDTVGAGDTPGATLNGAEPLLPLGLSTTTLHVPPVPVGGMIAYWICVLDTMLKRAD
jgi:hypothetical protein